MALLNGLKTVYWRMYERFSHPRALSTAPKKDNLSHLHDVSSSFDKFASLYDDAMGSINYCAPALLFSAISDILKLRANLDILDAGCGTGLCGKLLRPYSNRLDGIDISEQMIDKAKQLNLYDRLEVADMIVFMNRATSAYDIIVSGGALQFFADLDVLFSSAFNALRRDGIFAFTLDRYDSCEPGFSISPRSVHMYLHSESYVLREASAAGFHIISVKEVIDRNDMIEYKPVSGLLVVMQKKEFQ